MKKVALIGNPNCGKTSLFNVLTGLNQKVGNFPGVTVTRKSAVLALDKETSVTLIDLPGTNSLYPASEDEAVACQVLRQPDHPDHPDLVVVVIDGTQLKRGLLLASQVVDLGLPMVLAVNMIDLVEKAGTLIDKARLSRHFDVPVVEVSALRKRGINELKNYLKGGFEASGRRFLNIPPGFRPTLEEVKTYLQTEEDYLAYQAMLMPESFTEVPTDKGLAFQQQAGISEPKRLISNEMLVRFDRLGGIVSEVQRELSEPAENFTYKLDKIVTHRVWGYLTFVVLLTLIFQALFSWASYPMDAIDAGFGAMGEWLTDLLPAHWLRDLLVEGVLAGLGGIVIFVPQIAFLFFFIALLEETGYMSRVMFLMDRIMQPFGLSGKSVIPLVGGMACAIPSIMMARSIASPKERLITILVTPLMSCSARIPVYVLLIAFFVPAISILGFLNLQGLVMMGFYFLGFVMALLFALLFKKVLKHDTPSVFVTELPVYRTPRWDSVLLTMYQKSRAFVVEAGKIILLISIVLWFLASYGPGEKMDRLEVQQEQALSQPDLSPEAEQQLVNTFASQKLANSYAGHVGKFIEPAIKPLGFDWKIGISLLTSFAAREVFVGTMATIYSVGEVEGDGDSLVEKMRKQRDPETGELIYGPAVALSLLVFFAFAMQCMSTLAVTWKETNSWRWPIVMVVYLTALAYLASLLTYQGMTWLGA
jgi:ferrous iron transport protein B